MQKLQNKKVELNGKPTSYGEIIKDCLESIPEGGLTTTEIKKRLRVHVIIDKKTSVFQFEDADMETIRECFLATKWAVCSQVIIDLEKELGIK